jgi:hypothetical protein
MRDLVKSKYEFLLIILLHRGTSVPVTALPMTLRGHILRGLLGPLCIQPGLSVLESALQVVHQEIAIFQVEAVGGLPVAFAIAI